MAKPLGCRLRLHAWEDREASGSMDDGGRWLVSSNAGLSPSSPWLVTADDGWSGARWGHTESDVEAADVNDADVVCIRAIEE